MPWKIIYAFDLFCVSPTASNFSFVNKWGYNHSWHLHTPLLTWKNEVQICHIRVPHIFGSMPSRLWHQMSRLGIFITKRVLSIKTSGMRPSNVHTWRDLLGSLRPSAREEADHWVFHLSETAAFQSAPPQRVLLVLRSLPKVATPGGMVAVGAVAQSLAKLAY